MVQEIARRKPKLTLTADAAANDGVIVAPAARPWPVEVERVVANEVAAARATVTDDSATTALIFAAGFAERPSKKAHEEAREAFAETVETFTAELRDWLDDYQTAARERSEVFDLTLRLHNAPAGAHAEDVTVSLRIPDSVSVVTERPTMRMPPKRPTYQPPRPRSWLHDYAQAWPAVPLASRFFPTFSPREIVAAAQRAGWDLRDGGRELEQAVGDVYLGRTIALEDPLLLRASGSGRHEISWRVYSKSARRPVTGVFILEVPPDPPRPAFGRLHGIVSYPDVPLVDDDDHLVHDVRRNDPPLSAPAQAEPSDDDVVALLDRAGALWEWQALGLDSAADGTPRIEVRRAQPHGGDLEERG